MGVTYKDAGDDIAAGSRTVALMKEAIQATHGPEVLGGVGSFGGLFDTAPLQKMKSPVLVASTDGVGTKTKVATSVGRYDSIGKDIVNHCTDDILVQGARPLFFLDYVASSVLVPEQTATIVKGCAEACKNVGCALLGGETAEMPGVYAEGELDLVGTIVGVVDREKIIDGSGITPGDAVIGIASVGLHTNGFTLARKLIEDQDLTAHNDELGESIADALLKPHRPYLKEFDALVAAGVDIKGMAHITGGGLIDNPPRILPEGVDTKLDRSTWKVPPVFGFLQRLGNIADSEMLHAFNMGLGLLVYVPGDQAAKALGALGDDAWRVGEVVARGDGPAMIFQ